MDDERVELVTVSDFAAFDWSPLVAAGLVDRAEHFVSLGSTNDRARELAAGAPRGQRVLVVADEQTAGRGRGTNRWWTGTGSLAFSLLFDPAERQIERRVYPMISLVAAIAIVDVASAVTGRSDIGLHWPNDVFVAGRKLAGVLIEGLADGRHVLGIGCNVNNRTLDAPPELAQLVISLADLTGHHLSRCDLLVDLLRRVDERLAELGREPQQIGRRANELCLQHGSHLTVRAGTRETSGICAGIAPDGALLLDSLTGQQSLYSGVLVKER